MTGRVGTTTSLDLRCRGMGKRIYLPLPRNPVVSKMAGSQELSELLPDQYPKWS